MRSSAFSVSGVVNFEMLEASLKNSCIALTLSCGLLLGLSGCGEKQETLPSGKENANPAMLASSAVGATPQSSSSVALVAGSVPEHEIEMPEIARKNNCTACHAIDTKIVGPAWMSVSLKYKDARQFEYDGKEYPLVEGLMKKVSMGGSGHWGAMPMPPNDYNGIKQADIKQLVLFILGLAKQ